MKTLHLLNLGLLLFTMESCNYFKSTHPQAEMSSEQGSTGMNEKTILEFSVNADNNLKNFKKELSLVYQSGDFSMYAEKYSGNDSTLVYKTYADNGNISSTIKNYYFKKDSLILVTESDKVMNAEGDVFKDVRTYMRNNVAFRMDSRTASSSAAIHTLPYLLIQPVDNKYPDANYEDDIKGLNDAIMGKDKFEMVFDNITTYPEAHYINLKSKNRSNYKASLLVNTKDAFIDSLLNTPLTFKDEKLRLNWKIVDKEAVYVPVADTTTSASGLNK